MDNEHAFSLINCLCDLDIPEFTFDIDLDIERQRDIVLDSQRTRSDILTQEEKKTLEKLLAFYCKTEGIKYKQGMNEILAPFLLLNRNKIPLHICYTCFKNLIKKLIPTLFMDDVFII